MLTLLTAFPVLVHLIRKLKKIHPIFETVSIPTPIIKGKRKKANKTNKQKSSKMFLKTMMVSECSVWQRKAVLTSG